MMNSLKKYLYISLGIHLFIVIVMLIISSGSNIKQPFVVFGAHSKKDYHTLYKAKKSIIPFMGHSSGKSTTGKSTTGKVGTGKVATAKKSGKSTGSSSSKNKNLKRSAKKSKITEKAKQSKHPAGKSATGKSATGKSAAKKKQPITEPSKDKKSKKQKQKEREEAKKIEEELKKIEREEAKKIETQKEIEKEIKEKEKREAEKRKELEKKEAEKERELLVLEQAQQALEAAPDVQTDDQDDDEDDESDDDATDAQDVGVQEEFVFTLGDLAESQAAYSRHIQSETGRLWQPPLGVPKGTSCRVKFVISKDGKVEDFQTIQKSNVIIYDLSILRVAHLFKFDKCLWGKSFVIDFRQ